MRFLRHARYRTKMLLSYLIIVIIPLVAGLCFLYSSIVLTNEENIRFTLEQQIEQLASGVRGHMDEIDRASYLLSTNTTICQFIAASHATPVELISRLTSDILPICSWFEATTRDFYDFAFFSDNADIPETEIFHPIEKYRDQEWFENMERILSGEGTQYWEAAHAYHAVQYRTPSLTVFTLYRKMLLPDSGRTGYFAINVSAEQLFSEAVSNPLLADGVVLALGADGSLLAGESMLTGAAADALASVADWEENSVTRRDKNRDYRLIRSTIEPINAYLVAVVPVDTLYYMSFHSRMMFFLIALAAVGLTVLLAFILSHRLIRRINTMVDAVQRIQAGDFNVQISVGGNDEIDELARDINLMSARINELINTVYRTETLQKETEIRALQAQINPHFLFNVLETFKMMAEINDDEKLADGITCMGQLMRYNVSRSLSPATLREELQNLKSYISIQNLMLNNHLFVSYEIPPECLEAHVPRLLLQPLVENSIKHGYAARNGELNVQISAAMEEGKLRICITDNGTGMTQEELCALRTKVDAPENDGSARGIGLWNVNQRLKLIFGSSGLQFASGAEADGFSVIMVIPQKGQGGAAQNEPVSSAARGR